MISVKDFLRFHVKCTGFLGVSDPLVCRCVYCVHMCVHVCVCTCLHVCTCVCVHVYMCARVCVYMSTCVHVCVCTCLHVCTCVCVHVYMCECVCVCRYLCVFNLPLTMFWPTIKTTADDVSGFIRPTPTSVQLISVPFSRSLT